MTGDHPPGPFSLGQAEMIQSRDRCPYCDHKRGEMHPLLGKPACADQIMAGLIIRWHREKARDAEFHTAAEVGA